MSTLDLDSGIVVGFSLRLAQLNHIKFDDVVQSLILRLISNHYSIVALKGGLK